MIASEKQVAAITTLWARSAQRTIATLDELYRSKVSKSSPPNSKTTLRTFIFKPFSTDPVSKCDDFAEIAQDI